MSFFKNFRSKHLFWCGFALWFIAALIQDFPLVEPASHWYHATSGMDPRLSDRVGNAAIWLAWSALGAARLFGPMVAAVALGNIVFRRDQKLNADQG